MRKFILPQTRYVAVTLCLRPKGANSGAVLIGKVMRVRRLRTQFEKIVSPPNCEQFCCRQETFLFVLNPWNTWNSYS